MSTILLFRKTSPLLISSSMFLLLLLYNSDYYYWYYMLLFLYNFDYYSCCFYITVIVMIFTNLVCLYLASNWCLGSKYFVSASSMFSAFMSAKEFYLCKLEVIVLNFAMLAPDLVRLLFTSFTGFLQASLFFTPCTIWLMSPSFQCHNSLIDLYLIMAVIEVVPYSVFKYLVTSVPCSFMF